MIPPKSSGSDAAAKPCPRCGAASKGRFCSSCGAALDGAACRSCGTSLSAGAAYCHGCGTAVNAGAGTSGSASRTPVVAASAPNSSVPWTVAVIALVVLTAIVVAQSMSSRGAQQGAPMSPLGGGSPAPDISGMTPRQITDNLFNRVMMLTEAGLADSARTIASLMAIPAFDLHDSLDADLRYDLARIAEVTGARVLAQAQVDTILANNANHLLALGLSARLARQSGMTEAASALDRRLLAAEKAELAIGREEYRLHKADVDSALAAARRGGGG